VADQSDFQRERIMTNAKIACSILCLAIAVPSLATAQASNLTNPAAALAASATEDAALAAAIASDSRSAANKARDAFRHPYEALTFWGLTPGMTVVEIDPGARGWWTEILAPYAQATGGHYVAAFIDTANPETPERALALRAALVEDMAAVGASTVDFGPHSGVGAPDASADMVLVARALHGWARTEGLTERYMAEFFRVLKPGGVLAIEQHRAPDGTNPAITIPTGYISEAQVIAAAQAAGFTLDGRSEVNANPADTRDHPFGVWTLPPTRASDQSGRTLTPTERAAFDAIGESDRMTLRLRKPL
jgi:predicted methyltransferase